MKTVKIWSGKPSGKQLAEIASVLDNGGLVVMPTDTLYAVTCDALNSKAIEKLCRLKGINPEKTNLAVICSSISMAAEYAHFGNPDFKMLKANCPGPFTFLFRAASRLPRAFKGRKTVGIRIPDNTVPLQVAETLGRPLLTTSIEFDDDDHAINPDLIAENYENTADLMVDGGDGLTEPSTIVDCTGGEPEIVRQGAGELQ